MNQLRHEIRELLDRVPAERPPALRRSRQPDALYSTDLPMAASAESAAVFLSEAEKAGWSARASGGWIELDRPVPRPPEGGFSGPFGPEAACCLSLLRRHGQRIPDPERRTERMLVKAGEEGSDAYERACKTIHAEWAVLLRKGRMIPDMDPGFFGEGTIC